MTKTSDQFQKQIPGLDLSDGKGDASLKGAPSFSNPVDMAAERAIARADDIGRANGLQNGEFAREVSQGIVRPGLRQSKSARPTAADGSQSFHFRMTYVTVADSFRAAAEKSAGAGTAAAHSKYIERDGAAETFSIDHPADASLAAASQSYIEREASNQTVVVSSFGNIGDTYEQRVEFWTEVEKLEKPKQPKRLVVNPDLDAEFWDRVRAIKNDGGEIPEPLGLALDTKSTVTKSVPDDKIIDVFRWIRHKAINRRTTRAETSSAVESANARVVEADWAFF